MIKSLLGIGGSIATGGLNAFYTDMLNERNAERQNYYWNEQANKSFALGEKSADNAMQRQIKLYNQLQSPEAIKQQLLNAGLNPAMMYSQGGMGGQVSSGPQGQGGGSPIGVSSLGLQNILDPLTSAQIKNIEADTKNKEADTENISQDTKLKVAQEEYTKCLTNLTDLESQLLENRVFISNSTINEEISKVRSTSLIAIEDLEEKVRNNDMNERTFEIKCKTIEQNYFNIVAQGKIMELEQEKMRAIINNTNMDTQEKEQKIKNLKMEFNWLRNRVMSSYNEITKSAYEQQTEIDKQNLMKAEAFKIYEELSQKYGGWNKEDFFRMWESMWGEGVIPTIIDYKNLKPQKK